MNIYDEDDTKNKINEEQKVKERQKKIELNKELDEKQGMLSAMLVIPIINLGIFACMSAYVLIATILCHLFDSPYFAYSAAAIANSKILPVVMLMAIITIIALLASIHSAQVKHNIKLDIEYDELLNIKSDQSDMKNRVGHTYDKTVNIYSRMYNDSGSWEPALDTIKDAIKSLLKDKSWDNIKDMHKIITEVLDHSGKILNKPEPKPVVITLEYVNKSVAEAKEKYEELLSLQNKMIREESLRKDALLKEAENKAATLEKKLNDKVLIKLERSGSKSEEV